MMLDPKLTDYVSRYIHSGYSPDQVRATLLNAGWPRDMVDEAIRQETSKSPPYPTPNIPVHPSRAQPAQGNQGPPGLFKRLKMSFVSPGALFDSVKNEEGFAQPYKFFILVLLINIIILNIEMYLFSSYLITSNPLLSMLPLDLFMGGMIIGSLFAFVIAIIFIFIPVGLFHAIVWICGGRKGVLQTFKVIVYSMSPGIISLIAQLSVLMNILIPIIIAIPISIWVIILQVKGLKRLHEMSGVRATIAVLIPYIILLFFVLMSLGSYIFLSSYNSGLTA